MRLPNFFVVGVAKAGTTSLYNYLKQHPGICTTTIKETNYFSRKDIISKAMDNKRSTNPYYQITKHFKKKNRPTDLCHNINTYEDYLLQYESVTDQKAIGEVCNSYFFCPSSAAEIKKRIPFAKIIIIYRNPVERAFSHYMMNLREGAILENGFIAEVERDQKIKVKGWGLNYNYMEMGLYYKQLERYNKYFNREQVLHLLYEDYKKDPKNTLKQIYNFLNVDIEFQPDTSHRHYTASIPRFKYFNYLMAHLGLKQLIANKLIPSRAKSSLKNVIYKKKNLPQINDSEKQYLIDYYADDIMMLSGEIKRDLTYWLK